MNTRSIIPLLAMAASLGAIGGQVEHRAYSLRSSRGRYPATPDKLKLRAERKKAHIARCQQQALAEKCRLIRAGKGHNGVSMTPALLKTHNLVAA